MSNSCKLLFLILAFISVTAVHADEAKQFVMPEKYTSGIVWEIQTPEGKTSYLMGTMHIDHPEIWKLYDKVRVYLDQSTQVCTEVKMDFVTIAAEMKAMFFTDGRTLRTVLKDDAFYQRVIAIAEQNGMPEEMIMHMTPFSLVFLLSMPESEGEVLDLKIYNDAMRENKEVCGLETTDEHAGVFASFDMADQILLLRSTVENIDMIRQYMPRYIEVYARGDLAGLARLVDTTMIIEQQRLEERFYKKVVLDRNQKMFQRMQPRLAQGGAFFAVGALHLTGRGGLLRMLDEAGYQLKRLH